MSAPKLTPEHQRILEHKVLSMNRTPAELIEFLTPLAIYDRGADRMRKLSCGVAVAAAIALFFGGFFLFNIAPRPIVWTILGVVIVILVGSLINYRRLSKVDLSNNLRFFVFPVLAILREETAPREPVQIKLDLRQPTAKEKKTSENPPYAAGGYYKIVESFFVDSWFEGSTVLADHSKLRWSIVDHIRERKKTKRNPRGKIKTKTKYSRKTEMEVVLALPEKKYGVVAEGVSVEQAGKRNVMKFHRVVKSDNLNPLEPNEFVDLIAEAYRHAVPAQEAGA